MRCSPAGHRCQASSLLLLGAVLAERDDGGGVDMPDGGHPAHDTRQLLHDDGLGHDTAAGPSVFGRDGDAVQTGLPERQPEFDGEPLLVVDLAKIRRVDPVLGEASDEVAQFLLLGRGQKVNHASVLLSGCAVPPALRRPNSSAEAARPRRAASGRTRRRRWRPGPPRCRCRAGEQSCPRGTRGSSPE